MEGKKKFEKPEMKVVELKLAVLDPGSCPSHSSCDPDGCGEDSW